MWRWVDPDLCLLPQHLLAHGLASHFGEKTGRSRRVDFHPPSRTATPRRRLDRPARLHRAAVWTHAPPSLLPPRSHCPHPGRPFPLALSPPDRTAATRLGRPAQPGDRPLWLVSPSGCGAEGTRDPHCIAMCTECLTQTKERCVNPKEKPREEPPTARSGAATGSDPPARAAQRSGGEGHGPPYGRRSRSAA